MFQVPVEESKHQNDPEAGYKTEIAGGVPIKIPIRVFNFCYHVWCSGQDKKKKEKKKGIYSVILDNTSTLVILVGKNDTVSKAYRYLVLQLQ